VITKLLKSSQEFPGRIGGKQVDLALKNVMLRDSVSRKGYRLASLTGRGAALRAYLSVLSAEFFSGSGRWAGSLIREVSSLRGDSLAFLWREPEVMMAVSCWSWVEGKSSSS
jgi:hypothetical protein